MCLQRPWPWAEPRPAPPFHGSFCQTHRTRTTACPAHPFANSLRRRTVRLRSGRGASCPPPPAYGRDGICLNHSTTRSNPSARPTPPSPEKTMTTTDARRPAPGPSKSRFGWRRRSPPRPAGRDHRLGVLQTPALCQDAVQRPSLGRPGISRLPPTFRGEPAVLAPESTGIRRCCPTGSIDLRCSRRPQRGPGRATRRVQPGVPPLPMARLASWPLL